MVLAERVNHAVLGAAAARGTRPGRHLRASARLHRPPCAPVRHLRRVKLRPPVKHRLLRLHFVCGCGPIPRQQGAPSLQTGDHGLPSKVTVQELLPVLAANAIVLHERSI